MLAYLHDMNLLERSILPDNYQIHVAPKAHELLLRLMQYSPTPNAQKVLSFNHSERILFSAIFAYF